MCFISTHQSRRNGFQQPCPNPPLEMVRVRSTTGRGFTAVIFIAVLLINYVVVSTPVETVEKTSGSPVFSLIKAINPTMRFLKCVPKGYGCDPNQRWTNRCCCPKRRCLRCVKVDNCPFYSGFSCGLYGHICKR